MGRLEDLKQSLLDMTPEEVREQIRFVREDRKLVKTVAKMPAKKRAANGEKVKAAIAALTPEQKAALLKEIMG